MQASTMPSSSFKKPIGTGGFLDPEKISNGFGVKEGMKIADFGCGAGYFTIILAEKTGPEGMVYALDIQESALDNVKAKARIHNLENIETIRTNLEILGSSGLRNGSQDIVLLANILFQSQKNEAIIKESARVLKTGGELIIIDWEKGTDGFGPPDDLRRSQQDTQKLAEDSNFVFSGNFDAGNFHFGLTFKKK